MLRDQLVQARLVPAEGGVGQHENALDPFAPHLVERRLELLGCAGIDEHDANAERLSPLLERLFEAGTRALGA